MDNPKCPRCKGSGFLYDMMLNEKPCYVCGGKDSPKPIGQLMEQVSIKTAPKSRELQYETE